MYHWPCFFVTNMDICPLNIGILSSKAYHEWREPLLVNSNWYILMRNEYNHPTEFYPTVENPAYTTFQVKRAAHLAQQLLDYIDTLYRYFIFSGSLL